MPDSLRSSITRRRYRLAQAGTVAGSLAVGSLVVDRLVKAFREDFFLYYGISDEQHRTLQAHADAEVPLTLGQLFVAAIALVAVCVFVWSERRRLRQATHIGFACRRRRRRVVVERISASTMFELLVTRTSAFSGLLLSVWLLQTSIERWLGGLGLGFDYASWRSLLPLASIFGVCVLAGMLVAAVSLVGIRAIHVLEVAMRMAVRKAWRRAVIRRPVARGEAAPMRTFRELLGCDILSRPPPAISCLT